MINEARVKNFLILARYLNFSRAAEDMYISQQALSAQISALERDIGLKLFDRNTKSVSLTPVGQELFSLFSSTELEYNRVISKYLLPREHILRVGYFEDLDISIQVYAARDKLLETYADVAISLSRASSYQDILDRLDRQDMDLAILPRGIAPPSPQYHTKVLFQEENYVFVSPRHKSAYSEMTLADLKDSLFYVGSEPNLGRMVLEESCAPYGFTPKFYSGKITPSEERMLIEAGDGAGMGGRASLMFRSPELIRIRIDPILVPAVIALWTGSGENDLIVSYVELLANEFPSGIYAS